MPTVTIVQEAVPHYRVAFFEGLHEELRRHDIVLRVVTSRMDAAGEDQTPGLLPTWAEMVPERQLGKMTYQFAYFKAITSDLIVIEQANRHLLNYFILLSRWVRPIRVAFWGQGTDVWANPSSLGEKIKRWLLARVDFWFAYTDKVAAYVIQCGMAPDKVVSVRNATAHLEPPADTLRLRHRCVFIGTLYAQKRAMQLVEIGDLVSAKDSEFELYVVGDGPDFNRLEVAASSRPWLHVTGALRGRARDELLCTSQLVIQAGTPGLLVVDAFAARTPMVVWRDQMVTAESDYLVHGENCWVVDSQHVQEYANEVLRLLQQPEILEELRNGCDSASSLYTIDNMVSRFARGVLSALA